MYTFLEKIGLIVIIYILFKLAYKTYINIFTFYSDIGQVNLKKYGSWGVVTGCTDGIGKAYAEELAKQGLNLVLISKDISKLEKQAKELDEKYSLHTKTIAVDFHEQTKIYAEIQSHLINLDIGILVNNVGMGYIYPDFLENVLADENFANNMINCNVTAVTKMTGLILPRMAQKKAGIIINIASASGQIPTPLLTIYSATKAYVDFFSRGLRIEYKPKGIIVQSVCPYFVSTKLSGMRPSYITPKPAEFVANAIMTIGSQSVTNGFLKHNIQAWIFQNLIPRVLLDYYTRKVMILARWKGLAKIKRIAEEEQAKKK